MPPLVRSAPSLEKKLETLGRAASRDVSCSRAHAVGQLNRAAVGGSAAAMPLAAGRHMPHGGVADGRSGHWIYPAALPSGKRLPVLKVLQQGGCERGCAYCAERHGGTLGPPVSLSPDELARVFADLQGRDMVQGLFLSSAIRHGAVATMDQMLATAEIVRTKLGFRGYLHLKIVPGSGSDQVERAMMLASRVSVNMEAPTAAHLARVAPSKSIREDILAPMRQVARAEAEGMFRRSGQTTQLVVGVADETDREIARATAWLYQRLRLARVYYSAFRPVAGTPLQDRQPASPMREHRLYQMDFLLRCYGFRFEEIPFGERGELSDKVDPKTLWARANRHRFPLEVNTAAPEELMRVPGIGPVSARRVGKIRREAPIRSPETLRAAGVAWRRAAPYVLLDGRAPVEGRQLSLFPALEDGGDS